MRAVARHYRVPASSLRAAVEVLAARHVRVKTVTTPQKRLIWANDRLEDEDPVAFTLRAYATEYAVGMLHRRLIGKEDPVLRGRLETWIRSNGLPPGVDIPTMPEWNTKQMEKLGLSQDTSDPATRAAIRLYAAAQKRAQRLRAKA